MSPSINRNACTSDKRGVRGRKEYNSFGDFYWLTNASHGMCCLRVLKELKRNNPYHSIPTFIILEWYVQLINWALCDRKFMSFWSHFGHYDIDSELFGVQILRQAKPKKHCYEQTLAYAASSIPPRLWISVIITPGLKITWKESLVCKGWGGRG